MQSKQKKYFVGLLAIFITTCIVLILSSLRIHQQSERDSMNLRAKEFSQVVSVWLEESLDVLEILQYEVRKKEDPDGDWKYLSDTISLLENGTEYLSNAYLYNENWEKELISAEGKKGLYSLPQGVLSAFEGALEQEGELFVTDPYFSKRKKEYCITLSKAIYAQDGRFLCVVCIDCYLDRLITILGQFDQEGTYAFLCDSQTNIINHPHYSYQMQENQVTKARDLSYGKAFRGRYMSLVRDYDGRKRVCYVTTEKNTGFYIVLMENWDQVYGRIIGQLFVYVVIMILGLVFIFLIMDFMERAQEVSQRKLQEAAREAQRASRKKSAFLAGMSHEIRTPIHAILGMDEMILRKAAQPEIREYASHISQAGNTLLVLINSILDFSRLESGKMELIEAEYSLSSEISEMEHMVSLQAGKKSLHFEVCIDPRLPERMVGDAPRIRQVVLNLLSNALKYTKKGEVRLQVQLVSWEKEEAVFTVSVSDTGTGIRRENIDRILHSYERVEEEENRGIEGTGLGLAITKKLLSMMGSCLEISSEYGKGSEFSFQLKQKTVGSEQTGDYKNRIWESPEEGNDLLKQMELLQGRVLIVDDVPMNLLVMKNFLKDTRLLVDTAESGREAIALLREQPYDLLLLDHIMEEMDGLETLEIIRREHLADSMVCIVLTANAIAGAQKMYLEAGFDDYLTKPLSMRRLLETLGRYLKVSQNTEEEYREEENTEPEKAEQKQETAQENEAAEDAESLQQEDREDIEAVVDTDTINTEGETAEGAVDIARFIRRFSKEVPTFDRKTATIYCGSSQEFFFGLLEEFIADKRDRQLAIAFITEDWESYRRVSHSLKSTALMLGFVELAEMARELEALTKEGDLTEIQRQHTKVVRAYRKLLADISRLMEEERKPSAKPVGSFSEKQQNEKSDRLSSEQKA